MTEQEWLTSNDIATLLKYIAPRVSDRKQRLYLCGGCRQISHLFFDRASHNAIQVAERYADGLATEEEHRRAAYSAECPTFGLDLDMRWRCLSRREYTPDDSVVPAFEYYIPDTIRKLVEMDALPRQVLHGEEGYVEESLANRLRIAAVLAEATLSVPFFHEPFFLQIAVVDWPGADLIRCVFGNPFRTEPLSPTCLSETVTNLAAAIYTDRAFDRLPVLADALEDSGCTDVEILAHLRGNGVHARGCWPVDFILGKQ